MRAVAAELIGSGALRHEEVALRRYASEDERIGHDADPEALAAFLDRSGGAIWRIFWLHLQHPTHFPIYDQHVHRAMAFLLKRPTLELPVGNPQKVRSYLEHYRQFFRRFHEFPCRQADRAPWAFGRFLGSDYGPLLTTPAAADARGRTPGGNSLDSQGTRV